MEDFPQHRSSFIYHFDVNRPVLNIYSKLPRHRNSVHCRVHSVGAVEQSLLHLGYWNRHFLEVEQELGRSSAAASTQVGELCCLQGLQWTPALLGKLEGYVQCFKSRSLDLCLQMINEWRKGFLTQNGGWQCILVHLGVWEREGIGSPSWYKLITGSFTMIPAVFGVQAACFQGT